MSIVINDIKKVGISITPKFGPVSPPITINVPYKWYEKLYRFLRKSFGLKNTPSRSLQAYRKVFGEPSKL